MRNGTTPYRLQTTQMLAVQPMPVFRNRYADAYPYQTVAVVYSQPRLLHHLKSLRISQSLTEI